MPTASSLTADERRIVERILDGTYQLIESDELKQLIIEENAQLRAEVDGLRALMHYLAAHLHAPHPDRGRIRKSLDLIGSGLTGLAVTGVAAQPMIDLVDQAQQLFS